MVVCVAVCVAMGVAGGAEQNRFALEGSATCCNVYADVCCSVCGSVFCMRRHAGRFWVRVCCNV